MKAELRKKLKRVRADFQGNKRRDADEKIARVFSENFFGFKSFFIYNSFGSEADTSKIIKNLLAAGKKVCLPRVCGNDIIPVPYGKTEKGAFGVEEPVGKPYSGETEVTVIPLLAVNPQGYRTGYGRGYYDGYLKTARTLRVGLGYSFQLENFTPDEWDEPLDCFVCEKGITYFSDRLR